MRLDRLTNKTREALMTASQHAAERGAPEVHPEHLIVAGARHLLPVPGNKWDGVPIVDE